MSYKHTTIQIDNRCLDLLLTDDEIATGFARFLQPENKNDISADKCCSCWPAQKPPQCNFWKKILGLCLQCECGK